MVNAPRARSILYAKALKDNQEQVDRIEKLIYAALDENKQFLNLENTELPAGVRYALVYNHYKLEYAGEGKTCIRWGLK